MQLHQLQPIHRFKKRKRVGRGGKRGTYSGRGIKGQLARAGRRLEPSIRALIKRYPKLRGYKFRLREQKPAVVNFYTIERKFKSGETVNPRILLEMKLIRRMKGKIPKVKILGKGKLTQKLIIEDCQISKRAKEMVEKAGGKIISE